MGCSSCVTKDKGGTPSGCKSNGACSSGGCDKFPVFNWLSNMNLPTNQPPFNCVEARFKNGRKEYFRLQGKQRVHIGDVLALEARSGYDIGTVSMTGELVRMQMHKKKLNEKETLKVYRHTTQRDLDKFHEARAREKKTHIRCNEMAIGLKLDMKISDVEFQGDGTKVVVYYTANRRVDFRELIKIMAGEFRVRIEMRQIGARQEAARIGGIGSCGRELCCTTWLTDFRSVSTKAARYQQLSLNPQKLAGQCGKLKCCLNYELDTYADALQAFPANNVKLRTEKGTAGFRKMDIFAGLIWYAYLDAPVAPWVKLPVECANEIIAQNNDGKKPAALEDFAAKEEEEKVVFENVVGQDSLTRFDSKPRHKSKNRNKRRRNGPRNLRK